MNTTWVKCPSVRDVNVWSTSTYSTLNRSRQHSWAMLGIHIPSHSIKSSIWSKGTVYLEKIPKKTLAPISSEVIGTTPHHQMNAKVPIWLLRIKSQPSKLASKVYNSTFDYGTWRYWWWWINLETTRFGESNCQIQDMSHDQATIPKWDFMTQVDWPRNAGVYIWADYRCRLIHIL